MKIKTGDTVVVITGDHENDVGKQGKVLSVDPETKRIVVAGRKMVVRHTKPRKQGEEGGRIKKEGTMHVSNVMLVCPSCDKATRVGYRFKEVKSAKGTTLKKVRVCKAKGGCGKDID